MVGLGSGLGLSLIYGYLHLGHNADLIVSREVMKDMNWIHCHGTGTVVVVIGTAATEAAANVGSNSNSEYCPQQQQQQQQHHQQQQQQQKSWVIIGHDIRSIC